MRRMYSSASSRAPMVPPRSPATSEVALANASTSAMASSSSRLPHPAAVDRVMRADELHERGAALGVLVERALEGGDDLGGLGHVLAVEADRARHAGHARVAVVGDLPGVGVVALAPEAGAVARVAAVVDVDRGDADLVAGHRLEVAHHVADARVARHEHALPLRVGELGRHRAGQAEAEGGDIAPAEIAARDLGLVDGAG